MVVAVPVGGSATSCGMEVVPPAIASNTKPASIARPPAVVTKMLTELRQSKSQDEIRSRLEALERENAELRERAVATHEPGVQTRVPMGARITLIIAFLALMFLAFTMTAARGLNPGQATAVFVPLIAAGAVTIALASRRRG